MPALHIRKLDDAVIAALKARATRHHRSLEGEVRSILATVVGRDRPGARRGGRRLRLRTVRVGRPASYSRDVIYDDGDR
jgi:plasmid stability protein